MRKKVDPLVSVIVPVYNVEQYLKECVDSIIEQTYKNIEIILVDDGSTDQSPRICNEYKKKDSRVKVIHKNNGGLSDARNKGIDASNGSYIGFVDSDDWIEPNMYETLVEDLKDQASDISICGIYREYQNKTVQERNKKEQLDRNDAIKELLKGNIIHDHAWSKLYKKELFDNVRYPCGKVYEDIRTTYKLFLKCNRVSLVSPCLYHYRQRQGSIIRNGFNDKKLEWLKAVEELKEDNELNAFDNIISNRIVKTECFLIREIAIYGDSQTCKKYKKNIDQFRKDINRNRKRLISDKSLQKSLKLIVTLINWPLSITSMILRLSEHLNAKYVFYN